MTDNMNFLIKTHPRIFVHINSVVGCSESLLNLANILDAQKRSVQFVITLRREFSILT